MVNTNVTGIGRKRICRICKQIHEVSKAHVKVCKECSLKNRKEALKLARMKERTNHPRMIEKIRGRIDNENIGTLQKQKINAI